MWSCPKYHSANITMHSGLGLELLWNIFIRATIQLFHYSYHSIWLSPPLKPLHLFTSLLSTLPHSLSPPHLSHPSYSIPHTPSLIPHTSYLIPHTPSLIPHPSSLLLSGLPKAAPHAQAPVKRGNSPSMPLRNSTTRSPLRTSLSSWSRCHWEDALASQVHYRRQAANELALRPHPSGWLKGPAPYTTHLQTAIWYDMICTSTCQQLKLKSSPVQSSSPTPHTPLPTAHCPLPTTSLKWHTRQLQIGSYFQPEARRKKRKPYYNWSPVCSHSSLSYSRKNGSQGLNVQNPKKAWVTVSTKSRSKFWTWWGGFSVVFLV